MKIRVTRNTFIGGVLVQASPDPIEVDAVVGKQLIGLGKAVAAPEATAPAPVEPIAVETAAESAPVAVETAAESAPVAVETAAESAPVEPAPKEDKPKARGK